MVGYVFDHDEKIFFLFAHHGQTGTLPTIIITLAVI